MTSILAVLFIFSSTFFVWRGVLNQALIGEGPTYFVEPYVSMVEKGGLKELWGRHDVQALLFFNYVKDIFFDDMRLYMLVLLVGASLVGVGVYLVVKKVTQNSLFGVIGSILATANFVGSFEILGLGYYQWFIQRVPNFALSLFGFVFLMDYFKTLKIKYYLASLVIYTLAVYLARYNVHVLPLFVLYIFFSTKKTTAKTFLIIPFLAISYILIKAQSLVDGGGFFYFIKQYQMIPKVFHQVAFLTSPFLSALPKYFFPGIVKFVAPFVVGFYGLMGFLALRKNKKLKPILFTLLISIFASVYLSIFLNPYFADFFDTSRYLYWTSVLISIYWAIVIYELVKKKSFLRWAFYFFVLLWFIFNTDKINQNLLIWQERHDPVVATINYLSKNKDSFNNDTSIIVPKEFGFYASGMMNYLYREKNLDFKPNLDYEPKPKKYIELRYDVNTKEVAKIEH